MTDSSKADSTALEALETANIVAVVSFFGLRFSPQDTVKILVRFRCLSVEANEEKSGSILTASCRRETLDIRKKKHHDVPRLQSFHEGAISFR